MRTFWGHNRYMSAPVDPPRQPRPQRYALVVEDSPSLRALISGAVSSLGFIVEAVADAKAADERTTASRT